MRLRSDNYYIEHGMTDQAPGWPGHWWRLAGFLSLSLTWFIAANQWWVVLVVWSIIMSSVILAVTWFVASMIDRREKK